jgi:hypothetical protein
MARKYQFALKSQAGIKISVTMMDSIIIDDLVVAAGRAEAFRRKTGKGIGPDIPSRDVRDFLIKLGVVLP